MAQNKNGGANYDNAANEQNPIPERSVTVNCGDYNEKAKKGKQEDSPATSYKRDYSAWGFWFNVILTPITLLVAGAAVWQAIAANSSAQAIIRSERAWLLPDGEKIGMPILRPIEQQPQPQKTPAQCKIALKNSGNTPASAIDLQFELQLGDSTKEPPSFDIYTRKAAKDPLTPFPIGQDDHGYTVAFLTTQEYISDADQEDIWNGKRILWLCGIARYHDVFRQKRLFRRKPEEHLTFICLRYISASDGTNGQWFLGGPSGYNRAT